MNYDIDILEIGDIALVKSKGIFSNIISWSFYKESKLEWKMNRLPHSHDGTVGAYNGNVIVNGETVIYESLTSVGTVATPIKEYIERIKRKECEIIFARINGGLNNQEKYSLQEYLIENLGKPYDWQSYLSLIWRIFLRMPPIFNTQSKAEFYCTEYMKGGYVAIDRDWIRKVLPAPITVEHRLEQEVIQKIVHWY